MRCPWSRWTRGTSQAPNECCQANQAAGEITFLTGFLFFPAISIAVVLAAEDQGFFDDMCLDVNIVPSVPGESIVLISANVIQFSTNQIGELSQAQEAGCPVDDGSQLWPHPGARAPGGRRLPDPGTGRLRWQRPSARSAGRSTPDSRVCCSTAAGLASTRIMRLWLEASTRSKSRRSTESRPSAPTSPTP